MSEFSDMCKKIIEENGTSVYRLSIDTGLERTALHRMVNGKRIPNEQFVKQFIRALRVPYKEEKELLELYKCELIGETTYYNRRYVKQIINNLILESKNDDIPESNRLNDNSMDLLPPHIEMVLSEVLEEAYKNEEPDCICTNYPITNASFIREVLRLTKKYEDKTVRIKHLFGLKIKPEEVLYNLKVLNYMLPLTNSRYLDYESFFQYTRVEEGNYLLMMFPFYVMTNKHVLLFNNTFTQYIHISNVDEVKQYHKEFERILHTSRPLAERMSDSSDAFMKYITYALSDLPPQIVIESQPCFLEMLTEDTFLSILRERAPQLYEIGKAVVEGTYNLSIDGINFFSKEGLVKFSETGNFEGQIAAFLPTLDIEERKQALQYLLDRYENRKGQLLLMSEDLIYPENMYLEVTRKNQLGIYNLTDLQALQFFMIGDTNIGRAFADFALALVDSEYICSEEETEDFIRGLIENLN